MKVAGFVMVTILLILCRFILLLPSITFLSYRFSFFVSLAVYVWMLISMFMAMFCRNYRGGVCIMHL